MSEYLRCVDVRVHKQVRIQSSTGSHEDPTCIFTHRKRRKTNDENSFETAYNNSFYFNFTSTDIDQLSTLGSSS
jgi:hypothetical protein